MWETHTSGVRSALCAETISWQTLCSSRGRGLSLPQIQDVQVAPSLGANSHGKSFLGKGEGPRDLASGALGGQGCRLSPGSSSRGRALSLSPDTKSLRGSRRHVPCPCLASWGCSRSSPVGALRAWPGREVGQVILPRLLFLSSPRGSPSAGWPPGGPRSAPSLCHLLLAHSYLLTRKPYPLCPAPHRAKKRFVMGNIFYYHLRNDLQLN